MTPEIRNLRPFFFLFAGMFVWWFAPAAVRRAVYEAVYEFEAPSFVLSSRMRELAQYWELRSRSENDLIRAGRDASRLAATMQYEISRNAALRAENLRLEKLLGLPSRPEYRTVPARTVQRRLGMWWQQLVLRRGEEDGVRPGCPVVTAYGVVGRVREVFYDTCVVELISSPSFRISARIAGMENGADAYISKPFDPSYLQAVVANILENRKRTQQALGGRSGAISESAGKELQVSSRDREFLDKVFRLIDSHLDDENFSITQLAEELHISRSNFFYKMKSLTGLSPQEFLISYRLNRSVELLKTREYSVSEVAYKVGFSTLNGFSKAFRKKFGTPPSSV